MFDLKTVSSEDVSKEKLEKLARSLVVQVLKILLWHPRTSAFVVVARKINPALPDPFANMEIEVFPLVGLQIVTGKNDRHSLFDKKKGYVPVWAEDVLRRKAEPYEFEGLMLDFCEVLDSGRNYVEAYLKAEDKPVGENDVYGIVGYHRNSVTL